jgi:hypothetical protein
MRRVIFGSLQVLFACLLALTLYLFIKTGGIEYLSLVSLFLLGVYLIGRIKNPEPYDNNSSAVTDNDRIFKISVKTALLIFLSGLFLPLIFWLNGNIADPFHNPDPFVKAYILGLLISFSVTAVVLLVRGLATK